MDYSNGCLLRRGHRLALRWARLNGVPLRTQLAMPPGGAGGLRDGRMGFARHEFAEFN